MHSVFTAGANMFGVANLEDLAGDTHKFESRYLDNLIGPYPETKALYEARSPINHLEGFTAPMIVLQGDEDAIVPPSQSRMIVDALKKRSVPVAYIEFEGEQHGFRKAENIITALESELYFYGRVFGFKPANIDTTVEIFNMASNNS
jgi:dipeptidyl aminopeptidase/acylaminoacyl peptidase